MKQRFYALLKARFVSGSQFSFVALLLGMSMVLYSSCDTVNGPDERDPWLGVWELTDRCKSDTTIYNVTIVRGSNLNKKVYIEGIGLYRAGFRVEANITGERMVIPIQAFKISNVPEVFYEFSGGGSINASGDITIDYTVLTLQAGVVFADDFCLATGI